MADVSKITASDGTTYDIKDANVPHSSLAAASGGADLSLVTTGEKYQYENPSYTNVTDKPSINNVTLSGNKTTSDLGLFSGDYNDLTNKPTIPTELEDLSDVDISPTTLTDLDYLMWDSGENKWIAAHGITYLSDLADVSATYQLENGQVLKYGNGVWFNDFVDYSEITNTPTIPAAQVNSDWNSSSGVSQILNKPNLATVATSGSYNDLTDTPTIPAAQVNSDWNSSSGVSEILNKPTLATVATSGSYNDLSNTPTIPDGLADLTDDVNISSPTDGQVLKYDGTSSKWVNSTGGGSSTLAGLSDVNLGNLYDSQFLVYNRTSSKWENVRLGDTSFQVGNKPAGQVLRTVMVAGTINILELGYLSYNYLTDKPVIPDGAYSSTEHQVGTWVDGTTPVYEKTVELSSAVTAAAGNTSAAGAWTVLQTGWTENILPIEFFAWYAGGTDKTLWTHLTVQREAANNRLRVLNIRSTAATIDGFTIRYIKL